MRNLRDRRDPNHLVLFVTNRVMRGLPFIPRRFMDDIIASCMARAQERYPIQISHFLWMSNHFHMIASGQAKHLSPFMCQMQSEVARSIKKLFPKFRGKIWEGRFKEQRLCTVEDVIDKIVYLYMNPVKARLVPKAINWTGLSSLKMYINGERFLNTKWIASKYLKALPDKINFMKELSIIKRIANTPQEEFELEIKPDIWKNCFEESKNWSSEKIYNLIMSRIKEKEIYYNKEYKGIFIGMKKIKKQRLNTNYEPHEKSRTPFIICSDSKLRKFFIDDYREFCISCRLAWKKWKKGDISAEYVYGAYRPGMSIIGNLLSLKT